LLIGAVLFPAAAEAQRGLGQRPQRRELEQQVFDRFMTKVSTDMRLNPEGRNRLGRYVRQSGMQRRMLSQQTVQLRRRLVAATQDTTTNEAQIDQLLKELVDLRAREQELWNRDQAELANILTPRQRAVFMLEWMVFNDRIRDIMQGRDPANRPIR
jgi:hypothetical protein